MQTHFLHVFVANLKNDAIYAFYSESFCNKNLAIRKVFAFSDSDINLDRFPASLACGSGLGTPIDINLDVVNVVVDVDVDV